MRYIHNVGTLKEPKKAMFAAIAFVLVATITLSLINITQAAKPTKVDVCHVDEYGKIIKINVSENAVPAHEDHGDMIAGAEPYNFDCDKLIESVQVPGFNVEGASMINSTENEMTYRIEASGTYKFANWGVYGIADAEWAYRRAQNTPDNKAGWVKGEGYYQSECGLDVQIDNTCVDWGDFSLTNHYMLEVPGTGSPLSFNIYDNNYTDNSGYITLNIYQVAK